MFILFVILGILLSCFGPAKGVTSLVVWLAFGFNFFAVFGLLILASWVIAEANGYDA